MARFMLLIRGGDDGLADYTPEQFQQMLLQAGIAACHALTPSYEATDWPRILAQYDALIALDPSPVVALNRAVALAMVAGPATGLAALARIGDGARARAGYERALGLARTESERRFLTRKLAACQTP